MRKRRLGRVIIDCRTDGLDTAARFRVKALGGPAAPLDHRHDANYRAHDGPLDDSWTDIDG